MWVVCLCYVDGMSSVPVVQLVTVSDGPARHVGSGLPVVPCLFIVVCVVAIVMVLCVTERIQDGYGRL